MSFNIKNSFVSRAIVEDDKQVDAEGGKDTDEGTQTPFFSPFRQVN